MLPAERLLQSQEMLISKLSSYLDIVNLQNISIHNEDIEKLVSQGESGKIFIREINSLSRVVSGLLGDIQKNYLFTETVREKFENNRDKCSFLISQIEKGISVNSENLKSLKEGCRARIDAMGKTVPAGMKIFHSSGGISGPEFIDINV